MIIIFHIEREVYQYDDYYSNMFPLLIFEWNAVWMLLRTILNPFDFKIDYFSQYIVIAPTVCIMSRE